MMSYINVLRAGERTAHIKEVEPLVQLVAPFAPHIAEELWERFGHKGSIFDAPWPAFDAKLAADESVTVAVQVDGKTRGTVQVAPSATQDEVLTAALGDETIKRFAPGKPARVIYVPRRLLNIVTK